MVVTQTVCTVKRVAFCRIIHSMATWIIHLRLAEHLLARIPGLDQGLFAVGNIAPDSGVPDEKWEHFDPPPLVTHFQRGEGVHRNCADLEFQRSYLAPVDPRSDPQRYSFLLGYYFHLITDNLWSERVGRPTQARFAAQFAADPDFIWEVKKDWYGLDFIYLRDHPDSLFQRVFLDCAYAREDLDFLPAHAIQRNVTYIQGYYQRRDAEIEERFQRPYVYLSRQEVEEFVKEAARRLFGIYRAVCVDRAETGDLISSLQLVQ